MTQPATSNSGIYSIRNTVNGKTYIGSSVQMAKRWKRHLYELKVGKHTNPKLQNAFQVHGAESFVFEILCYEPDSNLLIPLEDKYIDELKPYYNCQKASATGRVDGTLSFRERVSKALKGIPHSEEHKRKIGEAHKGLKRSPEACRNIGNASRGRKHSEETKRKIGEASKGHKLSEEAKARIGANGKATKARKKAQKILSELVDNQLTPV